MADVFVDSAAAGGANNGTSWADAYISFGSSTGAAAGDLIRYDKNHAETYNGVTTWTWGNGTPLNPVRIHCVDKATGNLATATATSIGATANTQLSLLGNIAVHGLKVVLSDQLTLSGSTTIRQLWESCNFSLTNTGSNRRISVNSGNVAGVHVILRNCDIDLLTNAVANTTIVTQCYGDVEFFGGTIKVGSAASSIFLPSSRNHRLYLEGVDLSQSTETVLASMTLANLFVHFNRCALPSGWSYNGPPSMNARLLLENSTSGTISGPPLGLNLLATEAGTIETVTSPYRTGGADDGAQVNAVSWKMTCNGSANEVYGPMVTPPITLWLPGGSSKTLTAYVAGGTTLNDDDFWIDLTGPDETSPATCQGYYYSKRMPFLGTPGALTTDGASTWNGSGVGTKQKVDASYTPQVAGPVILRAYLAKPSQVAYFDPKIEVS